MTRWRSRRGIGGLTAANALARAGTDVAVYEAAAAEGDWRRVRATNAMRVLRPSAWRDASAGSRAGAMAVDAR